MLTGAAIEEAVDQGRIVIDPFDRSKLCANSYSFTLADQLLCYDLPANGLDARIDTPCTPILLPETGYILQPGVLYLGATGELLGGLDYAATLHAARSASSLGLRIQLSAPLGHSGAIIAWTLELRATMPVRVYPGMTIGKIAFWPTHGPRDHYNGRYTGSTGPVRSLLVNDTANTVPGGVIPSARPRSRAHPRDQSQQEETSR